MSYAEAVEYAQSIPQEKQAFFADRMGPQWADEFAELVGSIELSQDARRRAKEALEGEPSFLRLNLLITGALHSLFRGDTEAAISEIAQAGVTLDRLVCLDEQLQEAH